MLTSVLFFEHIFFCTADWANPIIGQIFKASPGFHSIIRISFFGIIYIITDCAPISIHQRILLWSKFGVELTFTHGPIDWNQEPKSRSDILNSPIKIIDISLMHHSILRNISPLVPHTGQVPGASLSAVYPHTGQT